MKSKICLVCGKEFDNSKDHRSQKSWATAKYCCRKCYVESFKEKMLTHNCDYCGKKYFITPFKLKRGNDWKNYCSDKCKWNARQKGSGLTTDGYVWIIISNNRKQIKLHRYLMEVKLGRELLASEIVHHKDHNKLNNDINNLEIVTRSKHNTIHNFLKTENRDDCYSIRELNLLSSDCSYKEFNNEFPNKRTLQAFYQQRHRLKSSPNSAL